MPLFLREDTRGRRHHAAEGRSFPGNHLVKVEREGRCVLFIQRRLKKLQPLLGFNFHLQPPKPFAEAVLGDCTDLQIPGQRVANSGLINLHAVRMRIF